MKSMWYQSFVMMFALCMSLTSAANAQAQFELGQDDPSAQQNQSLPVDEAFQFDFRQQGDTPTLSWEVEVAPDDPSPQQNQVLTVDVAAQLDFRQPGDKLTLSWEIADSYYMYQHR